jgi:hypothetical protein
MHNFTANCSDECAAFLMVLIAPCYDVIYTAASFETEMATTYIYITLWQEGENK